MGVLLLLSLTAAVRAQLGTISLADFWQRLRATDDLLTRALNQAPGQRRDPLDQINDLWADVTAVRYPDGTVIDLDVRWLTQVIPTNDDTVTQLHGRVQRLLDLQADTDTTTRAADLAALTTILAQDRFQYADATPTPVPFRPTREPLFDDLEIGEGGVPALAGLGRLLLLAGGIAFVAAVLVYLARGLRWQGSARLALAAQDDDPDTAADAVARAADAEASADYRAAIRYLYLSSLLLLDERGLLHYDRTLTNREHLRQIADQPELLDTLRPVVSIFERVWYGFMPVDEQLYQQFRGYIDRLHQLEAARS